MKKIGELLKKKQWRWTAAGVLCLVVAMTIFALGAGIGVQAENVDLGNGGSAVSFDVATDGSYLIKDASQMTALGKATTGTNGKTFRLNNDIEMTVSNAAAGVFEGTFDGNGHVITVTSQVNLTSSANGTTASEGLLFGTVKGKVQNLIVDIAKGGTYSRTTAPENSTTVQSTELKPTNENTSANAPYSGTENFSYQSSNSEATSLAEKLDLGTASDISKITKETETYYQVAVNENITQTTTYQLNAPAGTDHFGILCGTLDENASVEQVYVKGSTWNIQQNAGEVITGKTQTGTANRYFYYKQSKKADETTPSWSTAAENAKVTLYKKSATVEKTAGTGITLQVSAPKYIEKSTNAFLTYTVKVKNNTENEISLGSITATNSGGTWKKGNDEVDDWTGEKVAGKGEITYTYRYSVPENSVNITNNFTLTYSTNQTISLAEGLQTTVIDTANDGTASEKNENGLKVTLTPEKASYLADGNVSATYTLTLENTLASESGIFEKALTIEPSNIIFQVGSAKESVTWKKDSADFASTSLKRGESITLTGKVILEQTTGSDQTDYLATATVTPTKQINYFYEYEYVAEPTDSDTFPKYGTPNLTGQAQEIKQTADTGNALNAGIIAGTSKGSITQTKQEMTISGTQSVGNTAALKVGGIVGAAESGASASDLYILGTQNYVGEGSTLPESSALISTTEKPASANWASYEKYTSASASKKAFDLAWLVESQNVFTYSEPAGKKITVGINAKKTSKDLSYAVAYHARKAMSDSSEDTVYFTNLNAIDLGNSGYYRLLNTYATDGYYHYTTPVTELEDASYVYPYDTNRQKPYDHIDAIVERSTDPLNDTIKITFQGADNSAATLNGKLYYEIIEESSSTTIPSDESEMVSLQSGVSRVDFERVPAIYRFTPVIGEQEQHIYPHLDTREFAINDKQPLPQPQITCFDYYDGTGNKRAYTSFDSMKSYEAGTDMLIIPDDTEAAEYTIRYQFSADDLGGNLWEKNRYTGSEDIMENALNYADSAMIPEDLSEKDVYLYVEVSKKNFSTTIYRYGKFRVTSKTVLKASLNGEPVGEMDEEHRALDNDIVTLDASGISEIYYFVSKVANTNYNWQLYSNGIKLSETTGGYIYARIKYEDNKFGAPQLFDFMFGTACADPIITPNTGVASAGENAAAAIEPTTLIGISSRTSGANIFYVSSNEKQTIDMKRVEALPANTEDGDTVNSKKYFKVANRWYSTSNTNVNRYEEGIYLGHTDTTSKYMYISTAAIADGYSISKEMQYIYKVQPQQQVKNPEAALETDYRPGGETIESATVALGGKLSFYSLTPGVTLYYEIGSGSGELTEEIPSDGVTVTGEYGGNFVVRVQAKKQNMLPSEIITFVYKIAAQEIVNAPTATPGTSASAPAIVIPGNKILLSTTTKGASIFYTTDGNSPVVTEEANGSYTSGTGTAQYDPSVGIEMPMDGSGYFTITAIAVKSGLGKSPEVRFPYVYPESVMAPYATVSSGKVALNTKVLLKNLTEGATIYYNAAYGSNAKEDELEEPTLSSIVYSEGYAFTIQQKTIIKAMAVKDGVKSAVVTLIYEPLAQLAAPTASIETGSVVSNGTILYLKAASGASIYYTIDGSDPTDGTNKAVMLGNSVTLHGEPGGQITIKAYAKAENSSQSEVAMFTYQFSQNSMGGVTASVASGSTVSNGTKIILMSDLTGAEIYYTTNGESPVDHGIKGTTVEVNGTPGASFTIKAVARSDQEAGIVVTFIYKIKEKPEKPTASPGGGTLTVAARVSLDSGEETIYYTTDGTDPTKSSKLYSEPILINRTTTLKAIAVSADGEMSEIASYYYLAAAKAAMPRSDQQTGKVLESGSRITLTSDTPDAQIYYTTDGTDPTVNNLDQLLVYEEDGIEIFRSVTIKAVAYTEDMRMSNVSSFDYIVDTIPAAELKREEAERLAEEGLKDTDASALTRKNQSADTRKAACKLEEKEVNVIAEDHVKTLFGEDHKILVQYDVSLNLGRNDLSQEDAEISLPIPDGYENATLTVAALDSQNKLTTLESRREGGMLYVKAVSAGDYVIIGPKESTESSRSFSYLLPLEIASGSVLLAGIGYYANMKWKKIKIRKKTTQTSDEL